MDAFECDSGSTRSVLIIDAGGSTWHCNALMLAALARQPAALAWCIKRCIGGGVQCRDNHGCTPLWYACTRPEALLPAAFQGVTVDDADVRCVNMLLAAGAAVNAKPTPVHSQDGATTALTACVVNRLDRALEVLLSAPTLHADTVEASYGAAVALGRRQAAAALCDEVSGG